MVRISYTPLLAVALAGAIVLRSGVGDGPYLGTEFAIFVDSTSTLFPENEGEVVADPEDPDNPVLMLPYAHWASVAVAFDEEIGADFSAMVSEDPSQTQTLHLRMRVDASFENRGPCTEVGSNCLSISLFDAFGGPQDPASIDAGLGNPPMRLKWFIPDSLRDGAWHDLAIPLPPTTYAALENARSAGSLTPLQARWHYTGAWAEYYGIGCCGSAFQTTQDSLWQEFEWDAVSRIGVQYDFADGLGDAVYVDDFYIGDPYTDVSSLGTAALIHPTLRSPEDQAEDMPSAVMLRWTGRRGAAHDVQVSRDFTFATVDRDFSVQADTAVVEALAAYTTYHWRVRATGRGEATEWSTRRSFTIGGIGAPSPLEPAPEAVGVDLNTPFRWNEVTGGLSYRLQVATDTSFATPVYDEAGIPAASFSGLSFAYATRYFWRVRAESIQGPGDWSAVAWFDTIELAPGPPSGPDPVDQAVDVHTDATLQWQTGTGARHYELVLEDAQGNVVVDDTTHATSYSVSGLDRGGAYTWRVRSVNTGGVSAWLMSGFHTVMDPPGASMPMDPPDGMVDADLSVVLRWQAVPTASLYRVQVSHSITFDPTVADTLQTTVDSVSVGPLRPYRVHFWRVQAMNRSGEAPWSPVYSFRTVLNQLPVAQDDEVETLEDAPVDISVFANDSDPDADALSITALTDPTNGYAYETSPGLIRYIPFQNWAGQDSLQYTLDDGRGGRDQAMVRVTVQPVNDAPTAPVIALPLPGSTLNVQGDPARLLHVLWNPSTDVEGDSIRYRWQASVNELFFPLALEQAGEAGNGVSVAYGDLAAALSQQGFAPQQSGVIYHRVVAGDGSSETPGTAVPIPVVRGLITNVEGTELPTEVALEGVYPNPLRSRLEVRLALPAPASVQVGFVDILGRRLGAEHQSTLQAGRHRVTLDGASLAPGVYMVVARIGERRLSTPVVVTR